VTKQQKQRMLLVAAVVLLIAATVIALWPQATPKPQGSYYYDLGTGELYTSSASGPAPSGGEGVLAIVFACGDCANKDDRFVAYLSKPNEQYLRVIASGEPPTPEQVQNSNLVRHPTQDQWHASESPQGLAIVRQASSRCPETIAGPCTP
jgi:hypothetical protein